MNDKFFKGLLVVILLLLVGGVAYGIMQISALGDRMEGAAMMQEATDRRVEVLEKINAGDSMAAEEANGGISPDRPYMPPSYTSDLPPNMEGPTEAVIYENAGAGIRMTVPYNPHWGNAQVRIRPYDEFSYDTRTGIVFGPAGPFEGGGWARAYSMAILPQKLAADVRLSFEATDSPDVIGVRDIQTKNIHNLDVVQYKHGGLCDYVSLQVVGKKYNYEFTPLCGSEESHVEFLTKIIETIELIELP